MNVRYLTGFTGTNGAFLVGPAHRVFLTDFRYVERAKRRGARTSTACAVATTCSSRRSRSRSMPATARGPVRLGFDDAHMTVRAHAKLAELAGERVELVPAGGLVEELRAVKDEEEVSAIRRSAEIADDLYRWLISEHGLAGHTERDVALALERRAQDLGRRRALLPADRRRRRRTARCRTPTPRRDAVIPRDTLVVVDLGCVLDSYCSDCTRTFATGEIDAEARDCYELVRSAQEAALAATAPGADVREVDASRATRSRRPGAASSSGTGSGTASASRSTRRRGSRPPRPGPWRPATW